MTALGWTLFAALYAIGLAYFVAENITPFGHPVERQPYEWRWRWWFLAWPIYALSSILKSREPITRALKRKWAWGW